MRSFARHVPMGIALALLGAAVVRTCDFRPKNRDPRLIGKWGQAKGLEVVEFKPDGYGFFYEDEVKYGDRIIYKKAMKWESAGDSSVSLYELDEEGNPYPRGEYPYLFQDRDSLLLHGDRYRRVR